MRVLLINAPHPAIGSRIPVEQLPPLGLLAIGGPLADAGHEVQLLDAELGPLELPEIVDRALRLAPEVVLVGHSGSTSAHPIIADMTRALRLELPRVPIIYGGVFPTYHWREVLAQEPQIDVIVRGEGEHTVVRVVDALDKGTSVHDIAGIAHRAGGRLVATPPAPLIDDLDALRVGWELVDLRRYSYWGDRRAVVAQFSRGCPHACSYCGQRGFWRRFRHRDPKRFAAELAWLHRVHGVEVINFADENPTAERGPWLQLLEALIAENVPLTLIGSTRASDIVRDADILHLYKRAGVARFLLGTESTDEATLRRIRKGTTTATDREAIRLLRQHGIVSLATFVVGFEQETDGDYWRLLRQLLAYDPDQIQSLYATPHRWTTFFREAAERRVVQLDQRRWDYKHQVLDAGAVPPWRVLMWVKLIEAAMQLRPRALARTVAHPDPEVRHAMRWYTRIGRKVWPHEIGNFLLRDRRASDGPTLVELAAATSRLHARVSVASTDSRRDEHAPASTPAAPPAPRRSTYRLTRPRPAALMRA